MRKRKRVPVLHGKPFKDTLMTPLFWAPILRSLSTTTLELLAPRGLSSESWAGDPGAQRRLVFGRGDVPHWTFGAHRASSARYPLFSTPTAKMNIS